jgi:hypothetical protein
MPDEQNPAGPSTGGDGELRAINAVVEALKPLRDDERKRVLEYVLARFGAVPLQSPIGGVSASGSASVPLSSLVPVQAVQVQDIRSLKELKGPKSANEMAALVAFYLSEIAPESERRDAVTKADIEKYFKTAGFKLPADANFTLVNAKDAGYLDRIGSGKYKLNPVGYNLVAHRMGGDEKRKHNRKR